LKVRFFPFSTAAEFFWAVKLSFVVSKYILQLRVKTISKLRMRNFILLLLNTGMAMIIFY
jgi:hypothetical protein